MRQNPSFAMTDVAELRRLIDANPVDDARQRDTPTGSSRRTTRCCSTRTATTSRSWGTSASPDDLIHGLGERELLVVVQGPHGYISPGWYGDAANVPTWNFVSAHLTGIPELLTPEENLRVLDRLVARFESADAGAPPDVGAPERPRLRRASSSAAPSASG